MADVDIDLYDTIEDDFPQQEAEAVPAATNGNDLYDDVITSKPDEKVSEPKSPITAPSPTITTSFQTSSGGIQPRKHSIYVSNLTWWTNDEHVINACKAVGVLDILEVKFYENRANGQSRGFATVSTSSEETKQKLFEGLRSQSIHGQQLRTHYWTKSNLAMLDTASGGTRFTGENAPEMQQQQPGPRFMPPQRPPMGMGPRPQFGPGGPMRPMGGPMMGPRPGPMPGQMGMPGMGMANGQAGPMGPRPPMQQPGMMPPMQRPGMHPMQQQQQQQQPQMIQQNRPPMQQSFPTSQPYQQPGMQQQPGMGPGPIPMQQQMPAMSQAQPAPHVNPAFFPGGQAPQMAMQQPQQPTPQQPVMVDPYGRPIDANQQTAPQIKSEPVASSPQLSDVEFQEILTRNKSVSSSAISRAVQDASQGDFASAIETLVTAISLIKQSKIANDDRCKILIASLQDTKQGIEDKSYGGGSSRRLVRSRSRDRDYSAPARKRERSRSRDRDSRRDYRERSREKDSRGYYQESRSRDRYH